MSTIAIPSSQSQGKQTELRNASLMPYKNDKLRAMRPNASYTAPPPSPNARVRKWKQKKTPKYASPRDYMVKLLISKARKDYK
jgi:hypothetical protein